MHTIDVPAEGATNHAASALALDAPVHETLKLGECRIKNGKRCAIPLTAEANAAFLGLVGARVLGSKMLRFTTAADWRVLTGERRSAINHV